MAQAVELLRSRRNFILLCFLWISLWIIPWGTMFIVQGNLYLRFLTDMARLGIAIGIFMIPGILLYILLREHGESLHDEAGIIPIGFAFSVLIIAVIGLAGRVAGFSFSLVKTIFFLTGLVELILVMLFKSDLILRRDTYREVFRSVLRNKFLLFALILATIMTLHSDLFFIDDVTYSAYLTNWQHSERLGFENIVHRVNAMENIRFWLAIYPMGEALLADLSGVPGLLLIGNYLGPFLVPMAVVVSYWFSRNLGLSRRAAGAAVLLQISLYTWMEGPEWPVGKWFYDSLTEDKVAAVFFLAPVFFVMALRFVQKPTPKNRLLFILTGFSLMLTHPVMLFFSCSIAVLLSSFAWFSKKSGLRQVLEILIICIVLIIPYVVIQLSDRTGEAAESNSAEQARITYEYELERYVNVVNNVFYGLNPKALMFSDVPAESSLHFLFQFIRLIPIILMTLAGSIAVKQMKNGPLYWYVLSSILLVLFATVPYTGWILGYFVSARLIVRASWFAPLGLGGILIVKSVMGRFKLQPAEDEGLVNASAKRAMLWGVTLDLIFVSPFLISSLSERLPLYFGLRLEHNIQLAEIGSFIDQHTIDPTTVIAINYRDLQLLPSVTAHVNLVSFREETSYNGFNNFMSLKEIRHRIDASNTIRSLDAGTSIDLRCSSLREFEVRFVIVPSEDAEKYKNIVGECGAVQTVFSTRDLALMEFR